MRPSVLLYCSVVLSLLKLILCLSSRFSSVSDADGSEGGFQLKKEHAVRVLAYISSWTQRSGIWLVVVALHLSSVVTVGLWLLNTFESGEKCKSNCGSSRKLQDWSEMSHSALEQLHLKKTLNQCIFSFLLRVTNENAQFQPVFTSFIQLRHWLTHWPKLLKPADSFVPPVAQLVCILHVMALPHVLSKVLNTNKQTCNNTSRIMTVRFSVLWLHTFLPQRDWETRLKRDVWTHLTLPVCGVSPDNVSAASRSTNTWRSSISWSTHSSTWSSLRSAAWEIASAARRTTPTKEVFLGPKGRGQNGPGLRLQPGAFFSLLPPARMNLWMWRETLLRRTVATCPTWTRIRVRGSISRMKPKTLHSSLWRAVEGLVVVRAVLKEMAATARIHSAPGAQRRGRNYCCVLPRFSRSSFPSTQPTNTTHTPP